MQRAQLHRWRRGNDPGEVLDRGERGARRHDRVEHRVLLRRGDGEELGQLPDIVGGVISERIGGTQLLSDGRLGIGGDPLQVPQQSSRRRERAAPK